MTSTIANGIRDLLGGALFMLGAKNLVDHGNALSFKIGRNSKSVNYIKITLTSLDLYDVEFGWVTRSGYKIRSEVEGIYNDMVAAAIREATGMETTFPRFA